jgi:hypothetical protein
LKVDHHPEAAQKRHPDISSLTVAVDLDTRRSELCLYVMEGDPGEPDGLERRAPKASHSPVLEQYKAATAQALAQLEGWLQQPLETVVDRSERLGTLGTASELRARLEWLEIVGPEFENLDTS